MQWAPRLQQKAHSWVFCIRLVVKPRQEDSSAGLETETTCAVFNGSMVRVRADASACETYLEKSPRSLDEKL